MLRRYRPELDETLLLGLTCALAVGFYHMPYHLPLELALAAAVLVQGRASRPLRVVAAVFLASCLATSTWLMSWWEAQQGVLAAVWSLLLVNMSVLPAALAVLAIGDAVHRTRDPKPAPVATEVQG